MKQFMLMGKEIVIDDGRENYNDYLSEFDKLATEAAKKYTQEYKNVCKSMDDVSKYAFDIGNKIVLEYLEKCFEKIIGLGVYNYSIDRFADEYYWHDYYEYYDAFQVVNDKYLDIILTETQKQEYRESRKQNRARWQGGGFGLSGAIKGAATAGMLNMASGAAHSIANFSGNIVSSASANREKEKLFNNNVTLYTLMMGVRNSVYNMVFALTNYISFSGIQEITVISKAEKEEAEILAHNLMRNVVPEEKRLELIFQVINLNPYYWDVYSFMVDNYGDSKNEIEQISAYFGISVHAKKEKMISQYYSQLEVNTEEESQIAKKQLLEKVAYLGLNEKSVNEVAEIDQLLKDFDLKARTVDGKVFDSREEAILANSELKTIKKLLNNLDEFNEKDVLQVKEKIISLELQTGIQDKYIKKIDGILEKLDIEARTYKDVVYSSRELAEDYRKEDRLLEKILCEMDERNLNSIINASERITKYSWKTNLYEDYLRKIADTKEKILEERSKVLATFESVLSKIQITNKAELTAFLEKIQKSSVSQDVKDFVIEQIKSKVTF